MPKIFQFDIENFKGIRKVKINFDTRTHDKIFTLVGLNESGKTTVLEALSHFLSSDRITDDLFAEQSIISLIPIDKRAEFTGSVKVGSTVILDEDDHRRIIDSFDKNGFHVDEDSLPEKIIATKYYDFEDSKVVRKMNRWSNFLPRVAPHGTNEYEVLQLPEGAVPAPHPWLDAVNDIRIRLPQTVYFPTFLVEMPARIHLSEHEEEKGVNRYYRNLFKDILGSLNLKIDTHVLNRVSDFKEKDGTKDWFTNFHASEDKRNIDAVFNKAAASITREVLGNWQKVFNQPATAKQIGVDWGIDTNFKDIPYASFVVSDGESAYQVDQRSLGFRWFFSFLLFTRFRTDPERPTLFLFDEPAANLHAKAQAQLLESFSKIAGSGNFVVYSTHSHHMINPSWLSGAFIVENASINYDAIDYISSMNAKPTNIIVHPYRDFVSQQPERISYFQPVIEKLQYQEPAIVGSQLLLLVEGVSDFYAIEYVLNRMGRPQGLRVIAGTGAGSLGPTIARALAEGRIFRILLDDDPAGRRARDAYEAGWFLADEVALTLGAIDSRFVGAKLEALVSKNQKQKIADEFGSKSSKKQIGFYLAEIAASGRDDGLDEESYSNFEVVIKKVLDTLQ